MTFEISVEGQIVENVLKKLEEEFSQSATNAVDKTSTDGMTNQKNIEEKRQSIKKDIMKACKASRPHAANKQIDCITW